LKKIDYNIQTENKYKFMNVKKSLKEKNRLVKEIQELYGRLSQYNSVEVGNVRPYSPKDMLEQVNQKSNELVELKTKIHNANAPVYDKIFRLSELKSTISRLKSLDCTEGVSTDYYSRNRENPPVKTAEITVVERDEMVKFMEGQIEVLQDILDYHNQNTEI
jgi:Asp-tRNA(Asn)/Glu-tRNA(Gln) amidotransferase C subunit